MADDRRGTAECPPHRALPGRSPLSLRAAGAGLRRRGFTLLEVMVVVALLGLLTAVAAVRLEGPYREARLRDVVERLALTEEHARTHARRFARSSQLVYDLSKNLVYVRSAGGAAVGHFRLQMPGGVRLDQVFTRQQRADFHEAKIEIGPDGQTPSYAVRLSTAGGHVQWLFFSGVAGQVTLLETESDVEELFRLLDPSGAHPD